MKKILLAFSLLTCCILVQETALAQSWRWGKSGGSSDGLAGGPDEKVVDMTTDPNGNIYTVSIAKGATGLNVDGHALTGYGGQDIIVSSFKCDGSYRWSKVIGGDGNGNVARSIKADTTGGIYITGVIVAPSGSGPGHIDADTSIGVTNKSFFILKYDTAGTYKWIKMPQADTVSFGSSFYTSPFDLDVDGAGNSYTLCQLSPGVYAGGSLVVSATGVYILKYNSLGVYQGATAMQISTTGTAPQLFLKRNMITGNSYVTGTLPATGGSLYFNGTIVSKPMFAGSFNSSGELLWRKTDATGLSSGFSRANIDGQNNIYLAGTSSKGDTFNSYVVVNGYSSTFYPVPFIVKMNPDGNNVWAKNAYNNSSCAGITLALNGSEVDMAGQYVARMKWPGFSDSLSLPTGSLYDVFITRFDTSSGNVLGLDTLASDNGENEYPVASTSDRHGNFYIGGDFQSFLYVNHDTLESAGGGSDFFVAKFGYDNCGCSAAPTANYTFAVTPDSTSFTYTGSTGYDSVVWSFGDGGVSHVADPHHAYTVSGTYNACVTVYTSCGNNTYCHSVMVTTGSLNVNKPDIADITVYPNPAREEIIIEHGVTGTQARFFDLLGKEVYSSLITVEKETINVGQLAAGTYVLQLVKADGSRMQLKIVKD